MRATFDSDADLIAEAEAGIAWMSGRLHWRNVQLPAAAAALGTAFVAFADTAARAGNASMAPLWWAGMLLIFAPAAVVLLFSRLSRNEAISVLLAVGVALYCCKLVYAPGVLWGYDELLHFRSLDSLLSTGHLFAPNALLSVSPYYPGLEAATAAIVRLTGLAGVQSGVILIGTVRVLSVLAIFLLLERFASPSRFAAPATLFYMACPAFLYFDTMFSYESLALALSLVTLFVLAAAQLEEGARRQRLNIVGALLMLAVVVTHHVTSFILVGALVAWTLFQVAYTFRGRRSSARSRSDERTSKRRVYLSDLPGSLWVTLLGLAAVVLWLLNVASVTMNYLFPQLASGIASIVSVILHESSGRQLFQSSNGHSAPMLERITGLGSVAIILLLIPLSIKYLWERRHSSVLSHFFALGALGYPAILALRFTQNGWDVGSRATAFIYLPLAFTVAAGFELLIARRVRGNGLLGGLAVLAATVIFAGGIIAGTAPITRLPSPYNPGVAEVPYDAESLAAANWAAATLGPDHRFVSDSAEGALIGSVGRQAAVSSNASVSVSQIFLTPGLAEQERTMLGDGKIQYAVVDRRIAGAEPLKGFIFERWEKQIVDYGSAVSSETVNKFSAERNVSKEFDSGHIQFFELSRVAR